MKKHCLYIFFFVTFFAQTAHMNAADEGDQAQNNVQDKKSGQGSINTVIRPNNIQLTPKEVQEKIYTLISALVDEQ